MTVRKKIVCAFSLAFVILSCGNKENNEVGKIIYPKTLHINLAEASVDSLNLAEIAYKVEYIPLQTTDSSLLGDFMDFAITQNYFFVKNQSSVLTFDKYGKYINNLFVVGNGPGETSAYALTTDETREQVYILESQNNDVKIYGYNGTFVKTLNTIAPPEYFIYSIGYFNNNILVHTTQRPFVKYLYSLFDVQNNSIHILCKNTRIYDKSQENKVSMAPYDYHYQITDSTILYKESFSDTIFEVQNDLTQTARYIIDLGNKKLDWENWRENGMFNFNGSPPYGYKVQSFIESRVFVFIVLKSLRDPQLLVVYNKSTNSVKIFKNKKPDRLSSPIYLKNDLDNLVPFPPMNQKGYFFYYDGCLYSVIYAKDFVKFYKSALSKGIKVKSRAMDSVYSNITDFSNPIIMKVYLNKD